VHPDWGALFYNKADLELERIDKYGEL
jgi:hypothetical protein